MSYFLLALKKYAEFDGRSTRSEYWYFNLFYLIGALVVGIINGIIFGIIKAIIGYDFTGITGSLYSLAFLIPSIAVTTRRLHDVGKSGWMQLLVFLPIIGWIWLFILMVTDSQAGENEYGANPKGMNM